MSNQIVIAGPASQGLAVKIANYLGAEIYATENKVFADGECYLRIDVVDDSYFENKDCIIIQTTGANAAGDQNQHIIELIMMINAVKRMKAKKIRVVVPYLAYARQDKAFRPGECIFANQLVKIVENAGATEFYTIDIHAIAIIENLSIPAYNLDPMEILAKEVKTRNLIKPVVICPDKGAYNRSRMFASYLGDSIPVIQFSKQRDVKTGEITMDGDFDMKGRDAIIADDIIATGGTMASAFKIAKKGGANNIYAVGTHPLLNKNAVFTLMKAGTTEIIGTDTIDSQSMQVSMAEVIGKAIQSH